MKNRFTIKMRHLVPYKLFENISTALKDDIHDILTDTTSLRTNYNEISIDTYESDDGIYVSIELDFINFNFKETHLEYINSIKHLIYYMKESGYPNYNIDTYNIDSGRWKYSSGTSKDDIYDFLTNEKNTGNVNEIEFLFLKNKTNESVNALSSDEEKLEDPVLLDLDEILLELDHDGFDTKCNLQIAQINKTKSNFDNKFPKGAYNQRRMYDAYISKTNTDGSTDRPYFKEMKVLYWKDVKEVVQRINDYFINIKDAKIRFFFDNFESDLSNTKISGKRLKVSDTLAFFELRICITIIEMDIPYDSKVSENKEIDDDSDTMARYQLFEADTKMCFSFGDNLISDPIEVNALIKKYNETYNKSNEWGGGPVNREFIEYFSKKYKGVNRSSWKPCISLVIETPDYGSLVIGYSIINEKPILLNWKGLKGEDDIDTYDAKVRNNIYLFSQRNIYSKNMNIDDTIKFLSLKVDSKISWNWIEKEKPKNEFNY